MSDEGEEIEFLGMFEGDGQKQQPKVEVQQQQEQQPGPSNLEPGTSHGQQQPSRFQLRKSLSILCSPPSATNASSASFSELNAIESSLNVARATLRAIGDEEALAALDEPDREQRWNAFVATAEARAAEMAQAVEDDVARRMKRIAVAAEGGGEGRAAGQIIENLIFILNYFVLFQKKTSSQ